MCKQGATAVAEAEKCLQNVELLLQAHQVTIGGCCTAEVWPIPGWTA